MDAVMARRGPPCGAVHTVNSLRPTVRTGAAIPTIHCPHQQQHHDHHHNHRRHQHREAPQRQQQERPVDVRSRVRRDPIKAGRNDGRPCRTDGGAIAHTTGNLRGTSSRNASFEQTLREWQSKHPRVATPARRNPSIPAPHVNARHGGVAERRQGRCPRRHSHAHRT